MIAKRIVRAAAAAAGLGAALALLGWSLDLPALRSILPERIAMNPATAIALLCVAGSLWLQADSTPGVRRYAAAALALVALAFGALKLVALLLGFDAVVDRLLFASRLTAESVTPNRMAPNTAVAFMLLGAALWLLARDRWTRFAEILAAAAVAVAFFALLGYAYGLAQLYQVPTHIPMALNTALAFALLAAGALALRPHTGPGALLASPWAGGYLARRLFPAAIAIPPLLGALRLLGERAGLFDHDTGLLLMVLATILLLACMVSWTARALDQADRARRAADEETRDAKAFLEAIVENIPYMIFVKDAKDLRFIRLNRAGEKLLGAPRELLIGKSDHDLLPPEQAESATRIDRVLLRRGQVVDIPEESLETRTQGPRLLRTKKVPLFDELGTPRYLLGISEDITESRRAEQARLHLASIVESTDNAIISKTLDGTILSWNPGAERLYGYAAKEIVGKSISTLVPAGRSDEVPELLERIRRGERVEHFETVRARKDGREVEVSLTMSPMLDRAGRVVGASTIARDITEEKLAERAVAELNRELEAFSYSVSHDLRAPLRSVVGFTQILFEDHADALSDEARQAIERIVAASRRMERLIDDLLALSRLNRAHLRHEVVDLSSIAAVVAEDLREREPERRVEVAVEEGLSAHGDSSLLCVVLENLLGNAWKFTRDEEAARIEVGRGPDENGGAPVFFVRDNGAGFDMRYADKLFAPFQRLHRPDEFAGSGIGLATVQRIVQRHGGRVWAQGEVGRGATFFFRLR